MIPSCIKTQHAQSNCFYLIVEISLRIKLEMVSPNVNSRCKLRIGIATWSIVMVNMYFHFRVLVHWQVLLLRLLLLAIVLKRVKEEKTSTAFSPEISKLWLLFGIGDARCYGLLNPCEPEPS